MGLKLLNKTHIPGIDRLMSALWLLSRSTRRPAIHREIYSNCHYDSIHMHTLIAQEHAAQ